MPDKVAEILPQQDINSDATVQRVSGKGGVFVGGDDDIAAAQARYEAMKAVEAGTATFEQRQLLSDLDKVLQGARSVAEQQATPTSPVAPPPPPRPLQRPSVPLRPVAMPKGMPTPPRHSRHR